MPSVTVMVVNSRGVPPASFTPFFTDCAWRDEGDVAGRGLVPAGGDADEGLVDLLLGQAHRVVVAAMRRAAGPHRHVARRHARLVPAAGQHRCVLSWSRGRVIAEVAQRPNPRRVGGAVDASPGDGRIMPGPSTGGFDRRCVVMTSYGPIDRDKRNGNQGHGHTFEQVPDLDPEGHPDGQALAGRAGLRLHPKRRRHVDLVPVPAR